MSAAHTYHAISERWPSAGTIGFPWKRSETDVKDRDAGKAGAGQFENL